MIYENIQGKQQECEDLSELVRHKDFFFMYDSTFPYASGNINFPLDIITESELDLTLLEELNVVIDEPIKYYIENKKTNKSFKKKFDELYTLIKELSESAYINKPEKPIKYFSKKLNKEIVIYDELIKDNYVELNAFSDYIISVAEWSKTYLTYTQGEDSPSFPGGCSGYKIIWDENSKDSAINMNNMIRNHINLIKNKNYTIETNQKMIDHNIKTKLLDFIQKNKYLHPAADKWFELYSNILTNPKSVQNNSKDGITVVSYGNTRPSIKPIRFTGPYLIRDIVFKEHIEHAFNIGRIKEVDEFLRSLTANQWFKI